MGGELRRVAVVSLPPVGGVADPEGVDPDPTCEKKNRILLKNPDPDPTLEKN